MLRVNIKRENIRCQIKEKNCETHFNFNSCKFYRIMFLFFLNSQPKQLLTILVFILIYWNSFFLIVHEITFIIHKHRARSFKNTIFYDCSGAMLSLFILTLYLLQIYPNHVCQKRENRKRSVLFVNYMLVLYL